MSRYVLFISVIFTSFLIGQNPPPAVAVLDFEAKGIPVYEVETLTERLRSEIAKTKAIRLTDRKLLEKILQEQGLQQSGCTTDECAAEVGQLLGAQFMISGSIGKLGNTRNNVGTPVSAGIYFYQIQAKDFVKTRKMVLLK